MFSQIRARIKKEHQMAVVGLGVAGAISLAVIAGVFESLELEISDQFVRWRSTVTRTDERILVVTIDEHDLSAAGRWPISDAVLADVIRKISQHEPASIGLDIYRNLPIEPGIDELIEVFETTPNVIGIERVIGETVPSHDTLVALGQTASADLMVDADGNVRRGLLSVIAPNGEVKQGLAATLSLNYLSALGIEPAHAAGRHRLSLQLGKTKITRFHKNDGGYVNADTGGFQVLMNYRGKSQQFESVSLKSVLAGQLTDEKVRDRIVLIGSTAVSLNDFFYAPPEDDEPVAGIYIHAYLVSQLLDAALEGQPFLRTVPDIIELLWTCFWSALSIMASRSMLYSKSLKSGVSAWQLIVRLLGLGSGLGAVGYSLFLAGWWLPLALPMVAIIVTMTFGVVYRNQQLQTLAAFDELTQVANRRYFDQYLAEALKVHKQLSLILCDVDYFKAFNDRYGHPAGDRCLQQVAYALGLAVRNSDLVARYGGEEFVIVLPDTKSEIAAAIAERIQQQVRQAKLRHEGSKVSEWVTLSCGLATVSPGFPLFPSQLLEYADQALYEAKQSGRNRVVASQWQMLKDDEVCPSESV